METVFQYELPVLHPVAVHFPIALLVAALVIATFWLAGGRAFWRRAAALLLLAGTAGAVIAYLTGEAMHELSEEIPIVEELVDIHRTLALATLIASIVLSLGSVALELRNRSTAADAIDPFALRLAAFLLLLALAIVVSLTGHVGGIMVWGVAR